MTKRLKYTKDILTHMLNNNTNKGGTTPSNGNGGGSTGGMSRMGTVTSAVSSKRSVMSNNEIGGLAS